MPGWCPLHNEEYGFARNLLGLTPHWIAGSVIALLAAIALQMLRDARGFPSPLRGASLLLALLDRLGNGRIRPPVCRSLRRIAALRSGRDRQGR